jgi:multidrug efflux pump subunit AcrA (membrane-fusion protein)
VQVVQPTLQPITESIAASGTVVGRRETAVGAQVQGVVETLNVDEGDQVRRGQVIGQVRNDVARAQVQQAEQALQTARAQLGQAQEGARPSELAAARARASQADAVTAEREAQLAQARANLRQAEARRELARKDVERYEYLLTQKAVARQRVEQARTEHRVANAEVAAARQGVETAQASLNAARASARASRADVRTLEAGPKEGGIEVARQRVADAERALNVAREQAQNYVVTAPFAGTITDIVAEVGASVGGGGVVRLVETGAPEIHVDVDESNLSDLRVGQEAVVTSTAFRQARFTGQVTEISPRVDRQRGTVTVTVVAQNPPAWIRPGQTLDVNINIAEGAPRLVVPRTAVRARDDRRTVLVVQDGRAVERPVVTGAVEGPVVPILEGLTGDDRIVRDAEKIQPGDRVRVR